jgi:hypothetical protein
LLLRHLSDRCPTVANGLRAAEASRARRLASYIQGVRLAGLEELLTHLEEVKRAFEARAELRPVAFLAARARADFITAVEALLSGYHAVAVDAMRDVMEVEFLLREFRHKLDKISVWARADLKQLNDQFRPAVLRQLHANRVSAKPQDLGEAVDYKAHSSSLHVTPYQGPFGGPGIVPDNVPFGADGCFWEVFEHARRLLFELHSLKQVVAPRLRLPPGPRKGLKAVREAWKRTQEMQAIFLALMEAAEKRKKAEAANKRLERPGENRGRVTDVPSPPAPQPQRWADLSHD